MKKRVVYGILQKRAGVVKASHDEVNEPHFGNDYLKLVE